MFLLGQEAVMVGPALLALQRAMGSILTRAEVALLVAACGTARGTAVEEARFLISHHRAPVSAVR